MKKKILDFIATNDDTDLLAIFNEFKSQGHTTTILQFVSELEAEEQIRLLVNEGYVLI